MATDMKEEDTILLPIHYHLRFTFTGQDASLNCLNDKCFMGRARAIHSSLLGKMYENGYFYNDQYTSGLEYKSAKKGGGYCKAHIHIAFKSTHLKSTMAKTIGERFLVKEWDQIWAGIQAHSFKEQAVRCEEKFYRYPIKQNLEFKLCSGFSEEYLTEQHKIGLAQWQTACQINQSKQDTRDTCDTMFQRVFNKLEKDIQQKIPLTDFVIFDTFLQEYISQDKTINKQTIMGYITLSKLKLKLISPEQLFQEWS